MRNAPWRTLRGPADWERLTESWVPWRETPPTSYPCLALEPPAVGAAVPPCFVYLDDACRLLAAAGLDTERFQATVEAALEPLPPARGPYSPEEWDELGRAAYDAEHPGSGAKVFVGGPDWSRVQAPIRLTWVEKARHALTSNCPDASCNHETVWRPMRDCVRRKADEIDARHGRPVVYGAGIRPTGVSMSRDGDFGVAFQMPDGETK